MQRLLFLILALWLFVSPNAAMAQPYLCQRADACHGVGQMAMSPDGAFVAFTLMSTPATQFVLFEVETRRTHLVRAPADNTDLRDLAWSPDGDELTFATGADSAFGNGSRVWRLRPRAPSPLVLLAVIPHVRRPVLSADGSRLATFEGVVLGEPLYGASTEMAYAIFERTIIDGRAARRSAGHAKFAPNLFYDRTGALFIGGAFEPVFVLSLSLPDGRVSRRWGDGDEHNRRSWQWLREIRNVASFRVSPGEILPVWPAPFPARGALERAVGMRPTNDGRVIAYVPLNGANAADWYDDSGTPKRPTRELLYGYIAYDAQGAGERFAAPGLPQGGGRTGGADISADGSRFAQVVSRNLRRGIRPGNEVWDNQDTLEIYDRGELVFEARVSDLTANAPSIQPTAPYAPLMPITSTQPHRTADR